MGLMLPFVKYLTLRAFTVKSRDVRNGFFKFGSVLRKTAGSVRFQFQFGFEKNRQFGSVFCRSVVKYKKKCKLSFLCVHFAVF